MRKGALLLWGFLLALTLALGIVSASGKESPSPAMDIDWSVQQVAQQNRLSVESLLSQLNLQDTETNRKASLRTLGISSEQAGAAVRKAAVLSAEEGSKNWRLILLKFALWWTVTAAGVALLVRNQVTPGRRKGFLFGAVILFGVLLGSDPSPMGTVKDTIALLGIEHVLFPPRLIAFSVFTLMVVAGNKMICGWGCQWGALQDCLYQVSPVQGKIRVPFAWSQRIRIAVFVTFVAGVFVFSFDWIGSVDPFRIFSPKHWTWLSGGFILFLVALSFITYRPWCTFACPFGLSGWFFERFSWFKVRWDKEKCIDCGLCRRICPSRHTTGLLKGERHPADCYSCGACLRGCPVSALRYSRK